MSGYSRRCWHGVPRVLRDSFDETSYRKYVQELNLAEE